MVRTTADDETDERLLSDIQEFGWHLVGISGDDSGPGYLFSVGMFHTLGAPEICIFGIEDMQTMSRIVNSIGDLSREEPFEDWMASDEILEGVECVFRDVDRRWYQQYFGYCHWYYEGHEFPMLQCVWPDSNGRYPWDEHFDSQLTDRQPVLWTKSVWPFSIAKNTASFATRQMLDGDEPLLRVTHDDDGDWQFLCGTTNDPDDCVLVALEFIVERFPEVQELADLKSGWSATRESVGSAWERFETEDEG